MHAFDADRREEKSNKLAYIYHRTEWEKKWRIRKRSATALHISTIGLLVYVYVRAGVRTRRGEKKRSELCYGAKRMGEQERKKESNINYKQNARRRRLSLSCIDRPSARRRKSEGKKRCIYVCLKLHDEKNEKKKQKGGEGEEEEGCTYTNAIERVSTQAEKKKRQESFLVRAAYYCVIVDENEVQLYYHHHHLFFLINMLIFYVKSK